MKSTMVPLLALALVSTLAACTPPDDAQSPAPAVETPGNEKTPVAVAAAIPALRRLDETERAEPLVPAKGCNLESADGLSFAGEDITPTTPATVKVTGWLRADRGSVAAEKPTLRVEVLDKAQLWDVPVLTTIARDDLPSAATDAAPGFEIVFDASALPAGRYHLYLAYRIDGALAGCDNGRYITIL